MLSIEGRGGPVIRLRGELDAVGAAEVARMLAAARSGVRIDCSDVDRIDGAGLSALVFASRACRARGVEVVFSGIRPVAVAHLRARRVLDHVLPVEPVATSLPQASGPASSSAPPPVAGGAVQLAARRRSRRRGSSWRWRHS